jgi:hypothetical protein
MRDNDALSPIVVTVGLPLWSQELNRLQEIPLGKLLRPRNGLEGCFCHRSLNAEELVGSIRSGNLIDGNALLPFRELALEVDRLL